MDFSEIIIFALSLFAILGSLFLIYVGIVFYRLNNKFSIIVTEMAKGLDITTIRLERLSKILFNNSSFSNDDCPSEKQIIKKKEEIKNTSSSDKVNIVKKEDIKKNINIELNKQLPERMSEEEEI